MNTKETTESNFQLKDYRYDKALSRSKAIRTQCLICTNFDKSEIKNCNLYFCPLYPYRSGRKEKDTN